MRVYLYCFLLAGVTLPLEFDASRRAGRILRERSMLTPQELEGVGQVLDAAAWTYIAAFTMSFLQLLRLRPLARLPS